MFYLRALSDLSRLINKARGLWEKLPGAKGTPPAGFTLVSEDGNHS